MMEEQYVVFPQDKNQTNTQANSPLVRGRDLAQPAQTITLNGVQYPLKWGNMQARVAETVYEEQYGRDVDYMVILSELQLQKHRAIQACIYGALIAGGASMSWEDFDETFSYAAIDQLREAALKAILDTLPAPGTLGNGPATPGETTEETTDIPGRG